MPSGCCNGGGREPLPVLAGTWQTLASLIELHMSADEEICGPAVLGTWARDRVLARETRDGHEDIRELISETSLQPPGSVRWWHLARVALAAWAVQLDTEQRGPLAECRRRADPAVRERLAWQWRAFTEAQIRDQYPQAPPDIPTHQLRQDRGAPAAVRAACASGGVHGELLPPPAHGTRGKPYARTSRPWAAGWGAGEPAEVRDIAAPGISDGIRLAFIYRDTAAPLPGRGGLPASSGERLNPPEALNNRTPSVPGPVRRGRRPRHC